MSKVWSNASNLRFYSLHFSFTPHAEISFSSTHNISNKNLLVLEIKGINIIDVNFFHKLHRPITVVGCKFK